MLRSSRDRQGGLRRAGFALLLWAVLSPLHTSRAEALQTAIGPPTVFARHGDADNGVAQVKPVTTHP